MQVASLLDQELSSAAPVLEAEAGKVAALGAAAEDAAKSNRYDQTCGVGCLWTLQTSMTDAVL